MKIIKIEIDKFRQLEDVVLDVGLINELYGSNGAGKTSFISFISWILYGETLDYGKNDDMNIDSFKPNDSIGGTIYFTNGNDEYSIRRIYGYNEKGNKINNFFINGRKSSNQKEYYDFINRIFGIDKLNIKIKDFNLIRALSDPYYLPNKETQFRDFINSLLNIDIYSELFENEKYEKLKKDFDLQGGYDNIKAHYNQRLKTEQNNLLFYDTNIKEIKKSTSLFDENKYNTIKEELEKYKNMKFNSNVLKLLEDKMNDYEVKIVTSKQNDLINKPISNEEVELKKLTEEYNKLVDEFNDSKIKNSNAKVDIFKTDNLIKALTDEIANVKSTSFTKVYCPNCNTLINDKDFKIYNTQKNQKLKELEIKLKKVNNKKATIKLIPLKDIEDNLNSLEMQINAIRETLKAKPINYTSEETKCLINDYNAVYEDYVKTRTELNIKEKEFNETNNAKISELEMQLKDMENYKEQYQKLENIKSAKENTLNVINDCELRLSLLKEFKEDEIRTLENATSKIFGEDFKFTMLVENKTTDSFRNVCYANVDGLEHNRNNTAKYLKTSIIMLEKIKQFINPNCDIPTIFDIVDNIGKKTRNEIFDIINKSQIFYTRIADKENIKMELRVIK